MELRMGENRSKHDVEVAAQERARQRDQRDSEPRATADLLAVGERREQPVTDDVVHHVAVDDVAGEHVQDQHRVGLHRER